MISETFCVIPWVHISTATRGFYRFCCNQSYLPEDRKKGGYLDAHYIHEEAIKDVWNSKMYREARVKMLRGERLGPCSRCYREEEIGIKSARMSHNETYLPVLGDLDPDGFCPVESIRYIDVRLGNKCNLKCRMCNVHSSSEWITDEKLSHVRGTPKNELKQLEKMDWFYSDFFWDNLFSVMDNCEVVYFSGGEPTLLTRELYKLFGRCIENKISKNILLRFNTNLTTNMSKFEKYWKQFKHIRINCSVDGIGRVHDYIRYPSKWNSVEKNLLKVYDLIQSKKLSVSMKIMITPQMYNIFDLVNVFNYLKPLKLFPMLNILNQPGYYNIRVLHKDQKDKVANMITSWYETNKEWLIENDRDMKTYKKLPKLVDYMFKEDWSHLYPDFLKETYVLDGIRNQRLSDFIPELVRSV